MFLAHSQATSVVLGPFVNKDDALTPVTGLAGTMNVQLSRNGGALGARNSSDDITHLGDGFYAVPLDATDLGIYCRLTILVTDATVHLPVMKEYLVISADKLAALQGQRWDVNITAVNGTLTTDINDFKADVSGLSTFNPATTGVVVTGLTADGAADFYTVAATGSPSAGANSVVAGSQGSATETVVQNALTAQGYTPARAVKLDNLDASISGISGGAGGPGATPETVTTTVGGQPEDNVAVWLTTDAAGENWYAGTLYSNSAGEVVFTCDVGTYYIWREKGGVNFNNPQTLVVS